MTCFSPLCLDRETDAIHAITCRCDQEEHCLCWLLAYLFSNEPLIGDEWHGSENERQDLQAVETGEIVREVAIF